MTIKRDRFFTITIEINYYYVPNIKQTEIVVEDIKYVHLLMTYRSSFGSCPPTD